MRLSESVPVTRPILETSPEVHIGALVVVVVVVTTT